MDEIEVTLERVEGLSGGVGFIASVPIIKGTRKAAGMGVSPEMALTNLVKWLAGAATTVDLKYGEP